MSEPNVEPGGKDLPIGHDDRGTLVPRCRTLSGFALEDGCAKGVAIQSLDSGTTLIVQTRNSQYRVVVLDGTELSVLFKGGAVFQEATEVHLGGASAGGSLLKTGWIGVGLRMEMWVGARRIITSPVRSITIESVPPVQHSFQQHA